MCNCMCLPTKNNQVAHIHDLKLHVAAEFDLNTLDKRDHVHPLEGLVETLILLLEEFNQLRLVEPGFPAESGSNCNFGLGLALGINS